MKKCQNLCIYLIYCELPHHSVDGALDSTEISMKQRIGIPNTASQRAPYILLGAQFAIQLSMLCFNIQCLQILAPRCRRLPRGATIAINSRNFVSSRHINSSTEPYKRIDII